MRIENVIERVPLRQMVVECSNPKTSRNVTPMYLDCTVSRSNKVNQCSIDQFLGRELYQEDVPLVYHCRQLEALSSQNKLHQFNL
jgi:hypothetical protein